MSNQISETIYTDKNTILPMADVQHIEKLMNMNKPNGIWIITKHTRWNFEMDMWENPIYISEEDARSFISAWCQYRNEVDCK